MKNPFKPGDLVINGGRLLGQGYIWKVIEAYEHSPVDPTDKRPMVQAENIGPLHGKAEKHDYHIGSRPIYLASDLIRFDGINKPACQARLF